MKNNWKAFLNSNLSHEISYKSRFNSAYFLSCVSELRSGKVSLYNTGYSPSALTDDNPFQLQLYLELMAAGNIPQNEALTLCDIGCGQGHGSVFLLRNYLHNQSLWHCLY